MCGRFSKNEKNEALVEIFEAVPSNDLPKEVDYNVCPTDDITVVTSNAGSRRLRSMRWGLIPQWYTAPSKGPLLINARADTLAEKPAFREAARQRRCLIPATGFYEWTVENSKRLPWYIYRKDHSPIAFAGIWQMWDKGDVPIASCTIVTTEANRSMSTIHHRMPVILEVADWPLWLGEAGHGAARLMRPADETTLSFHRVGLEVNSNRAQGPELINPVTI